MRFFEKILPADIDINSSGVIVFKIDSFFNTQEFVTIFAGRRSYADYR
jgi:hypothetical protein